MTETDPLPSPETSGKENVPGAQALMRGLDVLMAIGTAPAPLRFGELQAAVGIPKGSLHRLLAALQSRDLIRYEENGRRYAIGSRVFDLARRTMEQNSVIRAAKPELARMARDLHRPVCLYVQDGQELFVLDFEDPDAAQTRVVRVWPRVPAQSSAPGLAIASRRPGEGSERAADPAVSQARALGYAFTGGKTPAVAAPIVDEADYPVAAICVHFDTGETGVETIHEIGRKIREASQRAAGNVGLSHQSMVIGPQPATSDPRVRVLATGRDFMGENPVWNPVDGRIWWLDVLAPALRACDPLTETTERVVLPNLTGGLALCRSGRFLLAGQQGIYLLDQPTGTPRMLFDPEEHKPDNRFNSASVDASGQLWIGTMPVDNCTGSGALYRIGPDLSVRVMLPEVALPKNAMLSPDGGTLYLSEGRSRTLSAYPLRADGSLGAPRVLVTGTDETGAPNGIAVDANGNIWVAMLGGWAVNCYSPDGALLESVALPVPTPTALCFGGADMSKLYVTSTYLRMPGGYSSTAPLAGNLLEISTGVRGMEPPQIDM
ncbi:SMP-30/gluconolactonase/LRE family protein [Pseudoruegeria sp. SHC-113]|uniref:SMP-30/gluconolactonase/LRE family protein n=1 Tax=Pseudoruegeria sp. SHC-113 TaxID=2855439 RepID=UPI0021BA7B49|nr:SMP-30/gluconolactonase/LRE family protein [Pseudoruegeria sp. SHC-113]MCT8158675.1 SMP-30/gluconolactonase/LRE family protein [Pseudoruegeria sp. SHC-113]